MRIHEFITNPLKKKQAKVVSDTNDQTVLVDPDTNTKTVVDKRKNPKAFSKNNNGKIVYKSDENPKDTSPASKLKPGDMIDVDDDENNNKGFKK